MNEIPVSAFKKAGEVMYGNGRCPSENVARFIADVSEKAKTAHSTLAAGESFYHRLPMIHSSALRQASADLASLILPNPEDDLLKEAREICAAISEEEGNPTAAQNYRAGHWDHLKTMRCTKAALRKGGE